MNIKQELQKSNNKLDKFRVKLAAAEQRQDQLNITKFTDDITAVSKHIASLKGRLEKEVGSKSAAVKNLAFNRVLTKAEQADMGKLKKSVRGLVVVHPMTALGREMGVSAVTGFAPKKF
ncbi:YibL family ribosome-associated protein [Oceanicoccus sp. KOV_DT_Chl]|uniref:YibL family ribosome-associated protein n=1 Tax=Oceanicoccus sp. KOV_DT_Chl TaxID=1904639 RepID=UPI000C7E5DA6|nr:YibL family ribosome-associated protein [Oceanicoccus sp. KOV_DT_Chl]